MIHETADDDDEPDYRFTLANERTFLAWNRTALALIAAGAALIGLLPELGSKGAREALGLGLLGLGGLVAASALVIWQRNQTAIRRGAALPTSVLPTVLTGGVIIVIVATMVILLVDA